MQQYAAHLIGSTTRCSRKVGASSRKLYSYAHALNGFAAKLTPSQAARLRKDKPVLHVWEDQAQKLDTNNSPQFLGLANTADGLRGRVWTCEAEGIIIGMIDTGAVQEHPSFDDTGHDGPPTGWTGVCQARRGLGRDRLQQQADRRALVRCGLPGRRRPWSEGDFLSARDSDGHGTHTATTPPAATACRRP